MTGIACRGCQGSGELYPQGMLGVIVCECECCEGMGFHPFGDCVGTDPFINSAKPPTFYGQLRADRLREATVEVVDRHVVWERDGGICGICGEAADPTDWDLDHITPIVRGGLHAYSNVQVSHPRCNNKKSTK